MLTFACLKKVGLVLLYIIGRSRSRIKLFTWSQSRIKMTRLRNTAYCGLMDVAIFINKQAFQVKKKLFFCIKVYFKL
jgi:hypothetical protein